jgi:hypothetical protein
VKKLLFTIVLAIVLSYFGISYYYNHLSKVNQKISDSVQQVQTVKDNLLPQPTVILDNGLPNKHIITMAFVPQAPAKDWSQPWQDACEEAALLTVNYYYLHENPSADKMINDLNSEFKYESTLNWEISINLSQISKLAIDLYHLKPQIIDNPTVDDIKKYISQNIPVIVPASGKTLFKENSHFKSGGPWYHNLVVLGYDDNRQQFIVHDVGTQFGAYYRYSYKLLLSSIHDFPPDGKKENIINGAKNVLVLVK